MQIWRWSVKCVVQLKLVGKTKQKNHGHRNGHVILLFSIKYTNNFGLKTNLTTFCAQIKAQILTKKKKKTHFKSTYLCIVQFYKAVWFIQFIQFHFKAVWFIHFIHNIIHVILATMFLIYLFLKTKQKNKNVYNLSILVITAFVGMHFKINTISLYIYIYI